MDFKEFRDKGLLWALNRYALHPRGYAAGFTYDSDSGEVTDWFILGNGKEPWTFDEETDDDAFKRFEEFLQGLGEGNG